MRELPLEHSRLEPPVRPVLHAVARRHACAASSSRSIACWLGARRARARRTSRRQPPRPPAPAVAADRRRSRPRRRRPTAADETPHSLFDQTWQQFQFGGRLTSIDGDPARFQRYQDVRDGVLFTDARYATRSPDGDWRSARARTTSASAISGTSPTTSAPAASGSPASGIEIPQFYSVDTATPYTRTGDKLVLDDATQRAIQNGQANLSAYDPARAAVRSARAPRHRHASSLVATPKPQLDLKATLHDAAARAASCRGARASDSATTSRWRCPTTRGPTTSPSAPSGPTARNMLSVAYTGSWFDNLDDTLIWDSPLRLDDSTSAPGPRADVALAVELGADGERRRLHQVGAHARSSPGSSRSDLEQRRAAAAVHDQLRAAAAPAAADDDRGRGARLLDQPEPRLAPARWTGASARGCATTTTPTRRRATSIAQFVNYDTSVVDVANRRAGALRAQPHELRCRRDVDEAAAGRADGRLHAQQHRPRLPHLREHRRERVSPDRRRRRARSGSRSARNTSTAIRTGSGLDEDAADRDRRAAGDAPLRRRQPDAEQIHRPGRRLAERRVDVQRVGRRRQGRLPRQLLRPAGVDRFRRSRSAPISSSRTAWAPAPATTTSATPGCSGRTRAIRRRRRKTIRSATGPPTRRSGELLLDLRQRRRGSARTPRARVSYDFSYAVGSYLYAIVRRAARCRRPISCPTSTTSCSSCTSTSGTGSRASWSATFSYLYEPFRRLRLRVRPDRRQQHRPAELAGPGIHLSALHRATRSCSAFGISGNARTSPASEPGGPCARTFMTRGSCAAFVFAASSRPPASRPAQDAARSRRGSRSTPRRSARPATPSPARARRRIRSTASARS